MALAQPATIAGLFSMVMTLIRGVASVLFTLAAQPSTTLSAMDRSDFGLTVSPSRVIVPADQTARLRQFTVTNDATSPVDVVAKVASFAAGPDGGLVFSPDAPYSAAEWVTLQPDHFHLEGAAASRVSLHIAVPATADPGERQVAVLFSAVAPAGHPGVGITGAVGAPVYVSVPGKTIDAVDLMSIRAPRFSWGGPVEVTAALRNEGTVHHDFIDAGALRAQVSGTVLSFPGFTLLRDATREVSTRWADPPLCVCRATVTVVTASGSESLSTTVVVVPVWVLGLTAVSVVVSCLAWWLWRRRRVRTSARPGLERIATNATGHV